MHANLRPSDPDSAIFKMFISGVQIPVALRVKFPPETTVKGHLLTGLLGPNQSIQSWIFLYVVLLFRNRSSDIEVSKIKRDKNSI